MLKDVIEILRDVSLRHKGVYTFRYQGDDLNNAQNNHRGYQVYVDEIEYSNDALKYRDYLCKLKIENKKGRH